MYFQMLNYNVKYYSPCRWAVEVQVFIVLMWKTLIHVRRPDTPPVRPQTLAAQCLSHPCLSGVIRWCHPRCSLLHVCMICAPAGPIWTSVCVTCWRLTRPSAVKPGLSCSGGRRHSAVSEITRAFFSLY